MKIKSVPEYNGYYSISDCGTLFSDSRVVITKQGIKREIKIKQLYPEIVLGYKMACLSKNHSRKRISVHRLVYMTFVGDIPKDKQINHKDGNKLNNHINNLELVTPQENIKHAWAIGLQHRRLGEERKNVSKLKNEDVKNIRKLYTDGMTQKTIANIYRVDQTTIHNIVKRKTWTHI